MNKKQISYNVLFGLSFIPFIGFFISWAGSWINIYNKTGDKKYIFLHGAFWFIPGAILTIILVIASNIYFNNYAYKLSYVTQLIVGLAAGYVALLILALSSLMIAKRISNRYDLKWLS